MDEGQEAGLLTGGSGAGRVGSGGRRQSCWTA